MVYIVAAILAVLFFIAITKITRFSTKQKVFATLFTLVVILFFYFHEQRNEAKQERAIELEYAFEHNKTLICEDNQTVHKSNYNYSGHSFLGKINSQYKGKIIPIFGCSIKP